MMSHKNCALLSFVIIAFLCWGLKVEGEGYSDSKKITKELKYKSLEIRMKLSENKIIFDDSTFHIVPEIAPDGNGSNPKTPTIIVKGDKCFEYIDCDNTGTSAKGSESNWYIHYSSTPYSNSNSNATQLGNLIKKLELTIDAPEGSVLEYSNKENNDQMVTIKNISDTDNENRWSVALYSDSKSELGTSTISKIVPIVNESKCLVEVPCGNKTKK